MATISFSFASPSNPLNPSIAPKNPTIFNLLVPQWNPQLKRVSLQTLFLKSPPLSHLFIRPLKTQQCPTSSTPITSLFTGIVEEMGQIKQMGYDKPDSFAMKIQEKLILEDINLGDSISVNGTCLAVADFDTQLSEFIAGIAPETLRRTSLIELEQGSLVNLERALRPSTRMGDHFVQGHVDGTGEIVELKPEGDSLWVKVMRFGSLARTTIFYVAFLVRVLGFIAFDVMGLFNYGF